MKHCSQWLSYGISIGVHQQKTDKNNVTLLPRYENNGLCHLKEKKRIELKRLLSGVSRLGKQISGIFFHIQISIFFKDMRDPRDGSVVKST